MSPAEAKHIVAAYAFELGHVETVEIRSRVVDQLNLVDHDLASQVADQLGLPAPEEQEVDDKLPASPALSQLNTATDSIETRKIAILAADGVDVRGVERFVEAMRKRGAIPEVLAPTGGGTLPVVPGVRSALTGPLSAWRRSSTTRWSCPVGRRRWRHSVTTDMRCTSSPRPTTSPSVLRRLRDRAG
jgi:Catalase-related immune-responsive